MSQTLFEKMAVPSQHYLLPPYFHVPLQQYALSTMEVERVLTPAEAENWHNGIMLRYIHRRFGLHHDASAPPVLLTPALVAWLTAPAEGAFPLPISNLLRLVGLYMTPFDRVHDLTTRRGCEEFYLDVAVKYAVAMGLPSHLYPDALYDYVNGVIDAFPALDEPSYPLSRSMARMWRHYTTHIPFNPANLVHRADFLSSFFNFTDLSGFGLKIIPPALVAYLNGTVLPTAVPGVGITGLMLEMFRLAGVGDFARFRDMHFAAAMAQQFFKENVCATLTLPQEVVVHHAAMAKAFGAVFRPAKVVDAAAQNAAGKYTWRPVAAFPLNSAIQAGILEWDEIHTHHTADTARLIGVCAQAGVRFSYTMPPDSAWKGQRKSWKRYEAPPCAPINLFHCRVEGVADFMLAHGLGAFEGRYNVGLCAWETDRLPDAFLAGLPFLDEIWVPSAAQKMLFGKATDKPVLVMPMPVDMAAPSPFITRKVLGLEDDVFYFLTSFDAFDWLSRKNPRAVVDAFQQAFPDNPKVGLIIKTRFLDKGLAPKEEGPLRRLQKRVEKDKRILFIHHDYTDEEMAALFGVADAYVSLHRASAFGHALAEAMAQGRPVITTEGGGPSDFASIGSALTVPATPCDVVFDGYTFLDKEAGHSWSDPDIAAAAAAMRRLEGDRAFARALGLEGQRQIRARYSVEACAGPIKARLDTLAAKLQPGRAA